MTVNEEDEFDEGYNVDVKEYFKQFFTNKSFFWSQLKLLITPEHEERPKQKSVNSFVQDSDAIDNGTPVFSGKNTICSEGEDDEENFEFEVTQEVEAPLLGQMVHSHDTDEEVELKQVLYNKAVPLSLIKEFQQDGRDKGIVIHAPKRKKKEPEESTDANTGVSA